MQKIPPKAVKTEIYYLNIYLLRAMQIAFRIILIVIKQILIDIK